MSLKVWMNGELVGGEGAKIGVYDHGLLYGDGVFEGIRTYGKREMITVGEIKYDIVSPFSSR